MKYLNNLPSKSSLQEWSPVILGFLVLYIPTYWDLADSIWASDEQGQGPIILGISAWFFWQKRSAIHTHMARPAKFMGSVMLVFALVLYFIGRNHDVLLFEVGSQILVISSLILLIRGPGALKEVWFPLVFLLFMVPLPSSVVDALTLPLKTAVSWAADSLLYSFGYPVSRTGVILQIGQYKLLVADACAGLHTLFTLESLGLLYLHLVRRESWFRNTFLAIAIVPISFAANTIRVVILALITYHFGDAAGQGFLHGFAGMVMFLTALILIIVMDSFLQFLVGAWQRRNGGYVHANHG